MQPNPALFTVHPNPASPAGEIHIAVPLMTEKMTGSETITITDIYVRQVYRQLLEGKNTLKINGLHLPAGTYHVQLAGIAKPLTRKLIIIK